MLRDQQPQYSTMQSMNKDIAVRQFCRGDSDIVWNGVPLNSKKCPAPFPEASEAGLTILHSLLNDNLVKLGMTPWVPPNFLAVTWDDKMDVPRDSTRGATTISEYVNVVCMFFILLHSVALYYIVSQCIKLYHIMSHHVILYQSYHSRGYSMLCVCVKRIWYYFIVHHTVLYHIVSSYCIMLYYVMLCYHMIDDIMSYYCVMSSCCIIM